MAAKLTDRMIHSLRNAAGNRGGHYASNISQGGGTAGALLRRELIESCDDGFRISQAGRDALAAISD